MRVAIHTLGTRGDVQPYVALARGLIRAGHVVSLAAPAQFEDFVGSYGVDFASLPREFLDLMDDPEARAFMAGSKGGFGTGFKMLKKVGPVMMRLFDQEWEAARAFGPDLIVFHPKALAAPHIAERLAVPVVLASPLPGFTPTAAFPSPMMLGRSPRFLNRMSHGLMAGAANMLFAKPMAKWRAEALDLPRRSHLPAWRDLPTLYAYSPAVLPVPPEWGPKVCVSGYWFLDDEDWSPPPALATFLEAGPQPAYIGFGSMPVADPTALTRTIVEAVTRSGQRAVVASGWGRLGGVELSSSVHFIETAPHDKLFPMMSAIVHHGGAGTTAAALRAGKPNLVCPLFGDQPFWGRLIHELGAGPAPIPLNNLTPDALPAALREMTGNAAMRARAAALGEAIRGEHGVEAAVSFIERVAPRAASLD
jgi:sterol 3beta-glucosyltransferase